VEKGNRPLARRCPHLVQKRAVIVRVSVARGSGRVFSESAILSRLRSGRAAIWKAKPNRIMNSNIFYIIGVVVVVVFILKFVGLW
jgi:hypothetical protein